MITREEAIKRLRHMIALYEYRIDEDNDAIDMAIEALKQPEYTTGKWIPMRTRPMTEDERKERSEKLGRELYDDEEVIYMAPLPDDGQNVLICLRNGDIKVDTFEQDDYGPYFVESDIEEVVAWMPLPEPLREEE